MEIVPFVFNNLNVRVIVIENQPWFVLADVCKVLKVKNPSDVRRRLNTNDVHTLDRIEGIKRGRGNPRVVIVSESGLYDVILRSDKPEAVEFRHWVTGEVLPTIRKTGGMYVKPGSQAELDLSNPDTALDALQNALNIAREARAKLELEQNAHAETKEIVALLGPVAESWMNLAEAEGAYSMADAAKQLSTDQRINIGRQRLFNKLSEMGWIFRDYGTPKKSWKAYQNRIEDGSLIMPVEREFWNRHTKQWEVADPKVLVTPKGLRRLHTALTKASVG